MTRAAEFKQAAEIIIGVGERLASIEVTEDELSLIAEAMGEFRDPRWNQVDGVDWEAVRNTAGGIRDSMASVAASSAAMRRELEGVKTFLRSFGEILEDRDRDAGTVM